MFRNIAELVAQAEESDKKIYEIMIDQEIEESEKSKEEILEIMRKDFQVMKEGVRKG
ncbi:hypothetical protein [Novisyntrophococcus fermenticellae]|uniref:hypothetical protein n=1 Tax=Novisyntrophococcus fermenticellae TaxID=2068655 RepID=UPI0022A823ED|nr:hypothetical protein [Novisyntrophococcus fermenticellae]